jgi:shikimate kinase
MNRVVYLEVSISNAAPRIGFNRDRPLLLGNPRQQWLSLMEHRKPIYESLAKYQVSTDNRKVNEVAEILVEELTR